MENDRKSRNSLLTVGVIVILLIGLIPLPGVVLDILIALNLAHAILIFLIAFNSRKITDFSLLPTVLLVSTIFGLLIEISSARLILTKGVAFDGRAIRIVASIATGSGDGTHLVIGFAGFIVFTVIVVLSITRRTARVSTVAAIFCLEYQVMQQLAIEAERSSGTITEEEALIRKNALQQESDIIGALDGTAKFISGNTRMMIFTLIVIILGGNAIGILLRGEGYVDATKTYMALSIGYGAVFLLPTLFLSLAAGCAASRGSVKYRDLNNTTETVDESPLEPTDAFSLVDALSLEIGYALIPIADKDKIAELTGPIQDLRRQMALDFGIVIPKVRIIDNMLLESSEYRIKIKGVDVGKGEIHMDYSLCINPGTVTVELEGEKTVDPVSGLPAIWVSAEKRDKAERSGFTVLDPPAILAAHLTEIIKQHASEFPVRQDTQAMDKKED